MADYIVVQKGDLNPSDFSNNNTNNRGGISVKVSNDAGNLLQKRSTGLYYGIEAPPDLMHTYVDAVNGVDAVGRGNRQNPVKTVAYAISPNRLPDNGSSYFIHLMENQRHELNASNYQYRGNGMLTFHPYGPGTDAALIKIDATLPPGDASRWVSKEIPHPTLVVTGGVPQGTLPVPRMAAIAFGGNIRLAFRGITIETTDTTHTSHNYLRGAFPLYAGTVLECQGVKLKAGNNRPIFFMEGCNAFIRASVKLGNNGPVDFGSKLSFLDVLEYTGNALYHDVSTQIATYNSRATLFARTPVIQKADFITSTIR